jgi:hypothetical protein
VSQGLVENRTLFSPNAKVEVEFSEQLPLMGRKELVATIKEELTLGLMHPDTAIRKLNPDWSEERLQEEIDQLGTAMELGPSDIPDMPDGATETPTDIPAAAEGGLELTQETVLNGAQVTSLLQVIETVANGTLDKSSAKAILEAAYNLSPERAAQIIDPIEVKEPEPPPQFEQPEEDG